MAKLLTCEFEWVLPGHGRIAQATESGNETSSARLYRMDETNKLNQKEKIKMKAVKIDEYGDKSRCIINRCIVNKQQF